MEVVLRLGRWPLACVDLKRRNVEIIYKHKQNRKGRNGRYRNWKVCFLEALDEDLRENIRLNPGCGFPERFC